MAKNWNVTVAGRERYISVEPAESGREVIRVDGRTAARPLAGDDQERVFEIDGERYTIRRAPEGFADDRLASVRRGGHDQRQAERHHAVDGQ